MLNVLTRNFVFDIIVQIEKIKRKDDLEMRLTNMNYQNVALIIIVIIQ